MAKMRGNKTKELTEVQVAIAREYLDTDITFDDLANKHGYPLSTVKYWVKKYKQSIPDIENQKDEYEVFTEPVVTETLKNYQKIYLRAYSKASEILKETDEHLTDVELDFKNNAVIAKIISKEKGIYVKKFPLNIIWNKKHKKRNREKCRNEQ